MLRPAHASTTRHFMNVQEKKFYFSAGRGNIYMLDASKAAGGWCSWHASTCQHSGEWAGSQQQLAGSWQWWHSAFCMTGGCLCSCRHTYC
jgi:hypothetical protein